MLILRYRYNTFYVLYPTGIASECWLIYLALEPARQFSPAFAWFLIAVLVIYIPGKFCSGFWSTWSSLFVSTGIWTIDIVTLTSEP